MKIFHYSSFNYIFLGRKTSHRRVTISVKTKINAYFRIINFHLEYSCKMYETVFARRENNIRIPFQCPSLPIRHKMEVNRIMTYTTYPKNTIKIYIYFLNSTITDKKL